MSSTKIVMAAAIPFFLFVIIEIALSRITSCNSHSKAIFVLISIILTILTILSIYGVVRLMLLEVKG